MTIIRLGFAVAIVGAAIGASVPAEAGSYQVFKSAQYRATSKAAAVSLNPQPLPPKTSMNDLSNRINRANQRGQLR
jgi:hypothetical protein